MKVGDKVKLRPNYDEFGNSRRITIALSQMIPPFLVLSIDGPVMEVKDKNGECIRAGIKRFEKYKWVISYATDKI